MERDPRLGKRPFRTVGWVGHSEPGWLCAVSEDQRIVVRRRERGYNRAMCGQQNMRAGGRFRPCRVLLVAAFVLTSSLGLGADDPNGILPSENVWTRVSPSVIWCGVRDSTTTIEAHIVGRTDVVGVRIVGPNETFTLYDDGTHGDPLAGDFAFTLAGACPYCHTGLSLKYGGTIGSWLGTVEATLANGTTLIDERPIRIGFAAPRYRGTAEVVYFDSGLSATSYAFFLQDIDCAMFDGYPVSSTDPRAASRAALRAFYSIFPDAFDLAIVMSGRTMFSSDGFKETSSQTLRTANNVEHIGVTMYNDAASCGSAGRLRGVVVQPFGSIDLLDSEVLNVWGIDIGVPCGLAQSAGLGSLVWNPQSDVGGQLASYCISEDGVVGRLASNGDGTWRLVPVAENEPYAPLELYIMGLVPAEDVPPMHILSEPDLTNSERIAAASVQTVTIEDIIAAHGGVRSPTFDESQKAFSGAFIVVQDDPFTDAEYVYYSLLSYHLMSWNSPEEFDQYAPFAWATGGRATLDTRLPVDAKPILKP